MLNRQKVYCHFSVFFICCWKGMNFESPKKDLAYEFQNTFTLWPSAPVLQMLAYGVMAICRTPMLAYKTSKLAVSYAGFFGDEAAPGTAVDFAAAATSATPAVVHIEHVQGQTSDNSQRQRNPFSDSLAEMMPSRFPWSSKGYSRTTCKW